MPEQRRAIWVLTLVLLLAAPAVAGDFGIRQAAPFLKERQLHINTRFEIGFNPKIEEALNKGIPVDVVFEINLVQYRWWWRNKRITDLSFRRRIQFHALSRQYLVSGLDPEQPFESFGSLSQALAEMGNLGELILLLAPKKQLEPGARLLVQLRAHLDIEALPTLMRPLAYVTPSWRLNSGWSEWPVQP